MTTNTRRFASPTGGRDVTNPQGLAVYTDAERDRIRIEFRHENTIAKWSGTPQMARQVAYLLLMGCAQVNGRFVEGDDQGFTVRLEPLVEEVS